MILCRLSSDEIKMNESFHTYIDICMILKRKCILKMCLNNVICVQAESCRVGFKSFETSSYSVFHPLKLHCSRSVACAMKHNVPVHTIEATSKLKLCRHITLGVRL